MALVHDGRLHPHALPPLRHAGQRPRREAAIAELHKTEGEREESGKVGAWAWAWQVRESG